MIGFFIFLFVVWLVFTLLTALMYGDTRGNRHRTYAECVATTMWWPILLPMLVLKFILSVMCHVPGALSRLWQS